MLSVLTVGLVGCGDPGAEAKGAKAKAKSSRGPHLVQLARVSSQTLRHTVERTGSLRALREIKVFNQAEGAIQAVEVREGDSVDQGDVLVRLDDRVLRAQLDKAIAEQRQVELNFKRIQRLDKKKLASADVLARAETDLEIAAAEVRLLQTRVGYMTVVASFSGKIAKRLVNNGDVAPKHTHLLTLVDPGSLVTDVSVSELLLPGLSVDDPVTVRIDALGDRQFKGRILRIYPNIDTNTRRGRLEVVLDKVPDGARSGQFSRVKLTSLRANSLVVPLSALRRDDRGEFVFRIDPQQRAQRTSVRSGLRLATGVEVIQGLKSGDRVVSVGFLGLAAGRQVQSATAVTEQGPGPDKKLKKAQGEGPS